MSVRIWIDPNVFKPQPNPHGNRYIEVGGTRQYVWEQSGLLYFDIKHDDPINPDLRRGIVRVTYQETIYDSRHMAALTCGRYAHGLFEATVKEGRSDKNRVLWINASAPTLTLLNRWLRHLLAGKDKPIEVYGRSTDVRPATVAQA